MWPRALARPEESINRLNLASNEFIATPQMGEQWKNDAAVPGDRSVAQFTKMIADDTAEYRRIAAPLEIRLD